MATGIVSIAAVDHGYRGVSGALAIVAAVMLAVLVAMAVARLRPDFGDLDSVLQLFTFVAACAVVGTRLHWSQHVHATLGLAAGLAWLGLGALAVQLMWRLGWKTLRDKARGGWELASVATSGLAILAADAGYQRLAVALLGVAVLVYLVVTGLVIWHIVREPAQELQPDVWILMGAAAIATLAGDHIHQAGVVEIWPVTVVTWGVATAWIPALAVVMVKLRRGNWWAMVFPLGMYSSATFATAVEMNWHWLTVVSAVFCWIALAAWLTVLVISARNRTLSVC
jgi:tellurite resistance protein TehA-like permease